MNAQPGSDSDHPLHVTFNAEYSDGYSGVEYPEASRFARLVNYNIVNNRPVEMPRMSHGFRAKFHDFLIGA